MYTVTCTHKRTHAHIVSKGKCPDVKLPQVSGVTSNLHSFSRVWTTFSDSDDRLFSNRPRLCWFHNVEENSLQRPSRLRDKLMQSTALALIPENKRIHHTHKNTLKYLFNDSQQSGGETLFPRLASISSCTTFFGPRTLLFLLSTCLTFFMKF